MQLLEACLNPCAPEARSSRHVLPDRDSLQHALHSRVLRSVPRIPCLGSCSRIGSLLIAGACTAAMQCCTPFPYTGALAKLNLLLCREHLEKQASTYTRSGLLAISALLCLRCFA